MYHNVLNALPLVAAGAGVLGGLYMLATRLAAPRKARKRLAFVMGGGVLVALPLFQLGGLVKSGSAELQAFAARPIDAATVVGGALFGAGWGLSGLCPGPGIVGAGAGSLGSAVWMCSMFGAREAVRINAPLCRREKTGQAGPPSSGGAKGRATRTQAAAT